MLRISGILPLLIIPLFSAHATENKSESADSAQTITVIDTSTAFGGTQSGSTAQSDSGTQKMDVAGGAVVMVSSEPQGAALLLNDSVVGVTPTTLSGIILGKHTLTLKMKGYYQKRVEIAITAADTQTVYLELLKPASVYFVSDPVNAELSLNGTVKGVTPLLDNQVKPGEYNVRLTLAGYQSTDTTLSIGNGSVDTLSFKLEAVKSSGSSTVKTTSDSSAAGTSKKYPGKLKKYSGIIGAAAFAVFATILLIGERNDL